MLNASNIKQHTKNVYNHFTSNKPSIFDMSSMLMPSNNSYSKMGKRAVKTVKRKIMMTLKATATLRVSILWQRATTAKEC